MENEVAIAEENKALDLDNDLYIFPNPAPEFFYYQINVESDKSDVLVSIYDLEGRNVKSIIREDISTGKFVDKVNIPELSSGIYIVEVAYEGKKLTKKVIVE